ncbi:hypothetical protein SISNIDRAFT_532527 [Sistotremastrum niveocremeum HHB9708]|uniref:Uncharacterized protein n=1 Tax=Sistotremastrum niveocremeum HHB9708 TaxID=1314777 RepID=A0A164P0F8_9AGAM|nr:hypothetical protein SISNIDRAFT_532527 [Sistotremastrum niveocremeum HHB9708]
MSESSPLKPAPEPTIDNESSRRDADANTSTIALLTDQFSALLGAVNALNVTMNGVKSTLVDHGTKFDVLIRDALKSLFMTGLLFQLRNLATSFEGRATILLATWEVGVVLAGGIAATMVGTTYHAVRYEASVFEGLVSRAIVGDINIGLAKGLKVTYGTLRYLSWGGWRKIGGPVLMEGVKRGWEMIKRMVGIKGESKSDERLSDASSDRSTAPSRWMRATQALRKGFEWMKTCRIKVKRDSLDELMNAYLEMITDASDPILLERAAASFCYRGWVQHGDGSISQLGKVYSRLTATDTSFRVRETVNAQISRFSAWIPERRKQIEWNRRHRAERDMAARNGNEFWMARWKEREEEAKKEEEEQLRTIQLTEFLIRQRNDDISRYFTPTWENCTHILDLISLSFDKFISKCLCIYDHSINLGNHHWIFFRSVSHCYRLLDADKSDDVTRILSHLDLLSAVRSFILADLYFDWYDRLLKSIIGDRGTEVLNFLTEFLSTPRDWSDLDDPGFPSAAFLIAVGSPPQFPSDLDLSPIITHIARHPSPVNWAQASDASIAYLVQCDISALSERTGVHEFLEHCVDREFRDKYRRFQFFHTSEQTRYAAQTLLDQHQALFIPLPPPSPQSASIDLTEENSESSKDDSSSHRSDSDQSENDSEASEPASGPENPSETHIAPFDSILSPPNFLTASEDHELVDMSMPPVLPGSGSRPSSSSDRLMAYLSQPVRAVYNWIRSRENGRGSQ